MPCGKAPRVLLRLWMLLKSFLLVQSRDADPHLRLPGPVDHHGLLQRSAAGASHLFQPEGLLQLAPQAGNLLLLLLLLHLQASASQAGVRVCSVVTNEHETLALSMRHRHCCGQSWPLTATHGGRPIATACKVLLLLLLLHLQVQVSCHLPWRLHWPWIS